MNEYLVTTDRCEYTVYADSFNLDGEKVLFYRGDFKDNNCHITAVFSEYESILRKYNEDRPS
jgi:hypothetical protein